MRTRDPAPVEALAALATEHRLSASGLLEQVLSHEAVPPQARGERALVFLAAAWAVTPNSPDHVRGAALLFENLWHTSTRRLYRAEHRLLTAQSMFLSGRRDPLVALLPDLELPAAVAGSLATDLTNPWAWEPGPGVDRQVWEPRFGEPFRLEGHAPPCLMPDPDAAPFDRLHAPAAVGGSVDGELVSVIMPCFRPDRGLLTSVRSILAQTYGNLEVLMVDDASGSSFAAFFDEASELDPRVRLITLDRNGGSYLAREAALKQASGTWVTFQDADDWSHPCRIQEQVEVLKGSASSVSRSLALRAHDDLTMQWMGYPPFRQNASSLLLRRSILDRWGGFIPVRKGADSELAERLEHLDAPIVDTDSLLAITRLRQGSLSRADFTLSWMAPDRIAFRSSFRAWHRQLAAEGVGHHEIDHEVLHHLPFKMPRTFVRDLEGADRIPTHYSTIFLADLSEDDSPAMDWLRTALTTPVERPVALWHQESPDRTTIRRPTMAEGWADLVQRQPGLYPVTRLDRVAADVVVILDPEALSVTSTQECRISSPTVVLLATPSMATPDASLLPADMLGLGDRVRAWFGTAPTWRAAPWLDEDEQRRLEDLVPGLLSPG